MLEVTRKMYENRIPIMVISLVGAALCLYGALEMRKLEKAGLFDLAGGRSTADRCVADICWHSRIIRFWIDRSHLPGHIYHLIHRFRGKTWFIGNGGGLKGLKVG